jgi:hypothetical protein
MLKKFLLFFLVVICVISSSFSQSSVSTKDLLGNNVISSAVPFLTIAPDSRAGAMGDAGVATSPDANSMHWNPAKYAFIENEMGASFSYTPWLRNLVSDMDLAYLSAYKRIDKQQVIAASLLYFKLGDIEFTNDVGDYLKTAKPNEFAIDVAYARSFGKKFSGGLAFRFIRSDLSNGISTQGIETKPGTSFATDISAYYNDDIKVSDYNSKLAFGVNISNIGSKMSYTGGDNTKDFIPINLRLGSSLTVEMDKYNTFTATIDLNKLLVPTPPIYDSAKNIIAGKDPNVPVLVGMFQSFYDAPGGFKEELHEISYSFGAEYIYKQQFAVRAGYFTEHVTKGNRKYFTAGLGLKFNVFGLDFSYLIPEKANNPLANTLRFTLTFDFNAFRKLKNQ